MSHRRLIFPPLITTESRLLPLVACVLLVSCGNVPFISGAKDEAVIYALGSRDGYKSPLSANLKPACPALLFDNEGYALTTKHQISLRGLFAAMPQGGKERFLIAGYAPPTLPQDHARALSERRAQAVRQHLIELGLEPANLQTVGFGNDFSPSGPSSDVVVIYKQ